MTDWKVKYEGLVRQLNAEGGAGVYPIGYLSPEDRARHTAEETDAYKCGWNDAGLDHLKRFGKLIEQAEEGVSDDMTMLLAADVGFLQEDGKLMLNMNDTWAWAMSWLPIVEPEQLPKVARLFRLYGRAGLMYWHSCQEKNMRSEFADNNRAIDFVRHEEELRKTVPDSSKRAYTTFSYTLGLPEKE